MQEGTYEQMATEKYIRKERKNSGASVNGFKPSDNAVAQFKYSDTSANEDNSFRNHIR